MSDIGATASPDDFADFSERGNSTGNIDNKFRHLTQHIADFIAVQEAAVNKLEEEETERKNEMQTYRHEFNSQIHEVKNILGEFQEMMTSVGVARFRVSALEALQQGREHLALVREQNDVFTRVTDEKINHIDKVTEEAEKRITRLLRSLRIEYFKKLVDDGCEHVEQVSTTAAQRVNHIVKWFHWEKLGIAVAIALVVAIVMGLFTNDEWPWETHQRVVAERSAGRILLSAWPHLSKQEKTDIQNGGHFV